MSRGVDSTLIYTQTSPRRDPLMASMSTHANHAYVCAGTSPHLPHPDAHTEAAPGKGQARMPAPHYSSVIKNVLQAVKLGKSSPSAVLGLEPCPGSSRSKQDGGTLILISTSSLAVAASAAPTGRAVLLLQPLPCLGGGTNMSSPRPTRQGG